MNELVIDLAGWCVCVSGVPAPVEEALRGMWPAFLRDGRAGLPIEVAVTAEPAREDGLPFTGKGMRSAISGGGVVFSMTEGSAAVGPAGPIAIRLEATSLGKQTFALINLLLASLAWRLPEHGGLVLHAAGIVLDGRAFLLVGAEGAGKSTWSRLAREGGATVLSDDIVLVREGLDGFEALSSPFRAPELGPAPPGRWPLAAVLGALHAREASLTVDPPLVVKARLAANVPYAVDGLGRHAALARVLDRLAVAVPHRTLAFAKDRAFVELLKTAAF